ncbi:DNA primase [Sediminivirga luteola]|uniref:DNA primase n=1 Tax=Sediminivirga luteola TaxID=1774748 RepID=UPI001F59A610|nr:DNA primase [Sediminivirga luteola]MCI2266241.1 DNA primase [Sediminivirga luteola]
MAGLIRREDIDEVRARTRIDEVVSAHVTLKNAGVDSMKGLCPFHDERTPSFHVRPQAGMYHCFGCGESGDVFTFLQKMDHVTFAEAVERLAAQAGVQLRYEEGAGPDREQMGKRQRLVDMHAVALQFFREQLESPEAAIARGFLSERGFDRQAAEHFGVGFAPRSWDALGKHLRGRGYTTEEILAGGLASQGNRGGYDRFRGRLMWPIRDVAGNTIGFGARRLYEDDQGPKYLNTPDTQLYHKNQVLYGIDLAKRAIAKTKQIVVVEGYTDVMACHLAGIETAVATCGTAFGPEHIRVVRRMLSDDAAHSGEVIFTFDGDEAGRKAALKAFELDQRFVAQTFVAVEPGGLDPCDLRQQRGDEAVRELVSGRRPLFEFALTSTLAGIDLSTVEGRVRAVRAVAPVVAGIRDRSLQPHYARFVAGRIGVEVEEVTAAVRSAARRAGAPAAEVPRGRLDAGAPGSGEQLPPPAVGPHNHWGADPADPKAQVQRQALQVVLQQPGFVNARLFDRLDGSVFTVPAFRHVHEAMRAAGGVAAAAKTPQGWPERVRQNALPEVAPLVGELAVAPLPAQPGAALERYCKAVVARLFDLDMLRIAGDMHARLQQIGDSNPQEQQHILRQLQVLEANRARLRATF